MGDLELSLDDIIKKKLKKTGLKRNRAGGGNMGKRPMQRASDQNNRLAKKSLGAASNKNLRTPLTKNMRGQNSQAGIGDARNKIIQKQRQKITDAREKLGQIAKQTDARVRLMKMRERQRGIMPGVRTQQARLLPEQSILQRTVQPGLSSPMYEEELMDYINNVSYLKKSYTERGVMDEDMYNYPFRARQESSILYRTVENDIPHSSLYDHEKSYSWSNPMLSPANDYADIPVSRMKLRVMMGKSKSDDLISPMHDLDDPPIVITKKVMPQETVGILKRPSSASIYDGQPIKITKMSPPMQKAKGPARTLSERFCQEGNTAAQKISLLKAKLEASQKAKNTQLESQPVGHRIVVSNLVPSVTHEDVKELFEDIGELLSSKVVRPGTAEVVYKLHKDAVRAVDVYHNRQLDGQPMKCLLVNNRSALPLASKSLKGAERKLGNPVVELDMTAFRKALHKKSTS